MKFTKMEGAGNDYVYVNCFEEAVENPNRVSEIVADRHFGIGGDGLILICPSEVADAKMRMFNADGSEGKMCGNGIRCVGKFVYDNNIATKNPLTIETLSGIKTIEIVEESNKKANLLKVNMGAPILNAKDIPTRFNSEKVIDEKLVVDGDEFNVTCVSMGNPHCIVFTNENVWEMDLKNIGSKFEKHNIFPESVNTEFINVIDKTHLDFRVWERGSGETLACGTGVCASVVAACLNGFCEKNTDVEVKVLGGTLIANYTGETVFMTGPARTVFSGEIDIENM